MKSPVSRTIVLTITNKLVQREIKTPRSAATVKPSFSVTRLLVTDWVYFHYRISSYEVDLVKAVFQHIKLVYKLVVVMVVVTGHGGKVMVGNVCYVLSW